MKCLILQSLIGRQTRMMETAPPPTVEVCSSNYSDDRVFFLRIIIKIMKFWWSVMAKMIKKRTKWFHRQKLKCLSTDSKCPNFESRLRLRASISNKRRQDFFLPNWSNYLCSVFSSSFSPDLIRSHLLFCFLLPRFDWIEYL